MKTLPRWLLLKGMEKLPEWWEISSSTVGNNIVANIDELLVKIILWTGNDSIPTDIKQSASMVPGIRARDTGTSRGTALSGIFCLSALSM